MGGRRKEADEDLYDFKFQISVFQGKNDPEAYIEWEWKDDRVFSYYNYNEEKKLKLVTLEFTDYVSVW